MLLKRSRGWEINQNKVTDEKLFLNRRNFIKSIAAGAVLAPGFSMMAAPVKAAKIIPSADPNTSLYPASRNKSYTVERAMSDEYDATTYNNFYEFGSHKSIYRAAEALETRPWTLAIDGLVEKKQVLDFDALVHKMPLEERVYRHRCVEAWSMVVPWTGFPLASLIALAKPLSSAKFVVMETVMDPEKMPGQKQHWYPWPYTEGLTIEEAQNELSLMVTGVYGKPIPNQMGAPLRLAVPWKYGFKSIKSIVRLSLTDKRPVSFWERIQPKEYGFWANVNPKVSHPRWSQSTERTLAGPRVPTRLYNGYAEYVADIYKNLDKENLFR
ncbi:MAG: protein-methionine-sulfoxide reductase catalytic subunit MsrP [Rhodospirillaceae bacterium]|nr:protein-methionine-sulfoxide reductase catalytic subunit MsrP [Rhodospirillaceae bacterium]